MTAEPPAKEPAVAAVSEAVETKSTEPKKRGVVSKVLGLPVALAKAPIMIVQRLIGGVLNAVVEVLKLPVRVLGGIARPWRRS